MAIFVTGHKNPDTDSVVSAIAYAALKNAMGERNVMAVRLGEINSETLVVLERFGFDPPPLINNVKTQLSDLVFDTPPVIGSGVTVRTAWNIMDEYKVQSICIADDDGRLVGTLNAGDIAEHDMISAFSGFFVDTNAFNLASALEGLLIGGGKEWDVIRGQIALAVHGDALIDAHRMEGSVLIAGDRDDIVELASAARVACLVLCEVDADSPVAKAAAEAEIHVVLTHYDAYRASRLISHSVPVSRLMRTEDIVTFQIDDFLEDVRATMLQHRNPSYPVLDHNNRVLGVVTRYHLLNHKRKQVILVDHNEAAQSAPGLDQAELLEVIDHHRLGDIQTSSPVSIRMEPVGSATTIVASMFFEHGVTPGIKLAGLIAGAILSDTVMFKSPTCTEKDKRMAYRMAQLANIDLERLGVEIFSAAANIAQIDPKSMLFQDFKEFALGDYRVGIGQVTCMDVQDLHTKEQELLREMEAAKEERGLNMLMLMETEIVDEGTKLLFVGDAAKILEDAFGIPVQENSVFLEGVMSRKKQVVPAISAVLA